MQIDVAGKMFVDNHPLNTLKLPLIARLFPDAKILFACRGPARHRAVVFRHRFQMSAPIYELLSIEVRQPTTTPSCKLSFA